MQHYTVRFLPDEQTISIHAGATLLEAAAKAGVILNAVCGGAGTCGKCIVLLGREKRRVLACQTLVDQDLMVTVTQESRFYRHQILDQGIHHDTVILPAVRKVFLKPSGESPQAIMASLREAGIPTDRFGKVRSEITPGDDLVNGITAVCLADLDSDGLERWELVGMEKHDTTDRLYGVVADVGTTTVVVRLLDLTNGKVLATACETNPQIQFGDDVISRIHHAQTDTGAEQLQQCIIDCLNRLIGQGCRKAAIKPENIYEVVSVGNTTMGHLLTGLSVQSLGQAPYMACSLAPQQRQAGEIGLSSIHPKGRLHMLANIAGFVGADTTAVALALNLDEVRTTTLVVDIGTNGELLLTTDKGIYAASCAAGPALEGARILHGSRAMEGAIQSVVIANGDLDVDVIGGIKAHSICGSGLIDAVAVLLEVGVVDGTGRLLGTDTAVLPEAIRARCMQWEGQPAFVFAGREGDPKEKVVLTQRDIRETQLAKGAIRAGIELLLARAGCKAEDLGQILLAGAFGSYIRRESALRIGLLPPISPDRIHFIGNAALSGAQTALLNRQCRRHSASLAESIIYVEIAHQAEFQDVFSGAMLF
ncbi:MAG: DUF4445 domain-containing protein [Sedimentisphaerales bacterium]|nr:DUF4445 domain-containing protein [Sedimentisphaerales bacterium]